MFYSFSHEFPLWPVIHERFDDWSRDATIPPSLRVKIIIVFFRVFSICPWL